MSLLSPKPVIARVVRTWRVHPGMTFALVEDVERHLWIVEPCPAGTHFWTVAQAAELPQGARTRHALQQAIREGRQLEAAQQARASRIARLGERMAPPQAASETRTPSHPSAEADSYHLRRRKVRSVRPVGAAKTLTGA